MEGRIAFGELLRRLPSFSRAPGKVAWNPSFGLRGLQALPLDFDHPAAPA
jgi:cytochrome P450